MAPLCKMLPGYLKACSLLALGVSADSIVSDPHTYFGDSDTHYSLRTALGEAQEEYASVIILMYSSSHVTYLPYLTCGVSCRSGVWTHATKGTTEMKFRLGAPFWDRDANHLPPHQLLDDLLHELGLSTVATTMHDQLKTLKDRDGWRGVQDRRIQAAAGSMLQLGWLGVPFEEVWHHVITSFCRCCELHVCCDVIVPCACGMCASMRSLNAHGMYAIGFSFPWMRVHDCRLVCR